MLQTIAHSKCHKTLHPTLKFQVSDDLRAGDVLGYSFVPMMDSPGNNIIDLPVAPLADISAACDAEEACVGFTSDGVLKSALLPADAWTRWTTNPYLGLYTKNPGTCRCEHLLTRCAIVMNF